MCRRGHSCRASFFVRHTWDPGAGAVMINSAIVIVTPTMSSVASEAAVSLFIDGTWIQVCALGSDHFFLARLALFFRRRLDLPLVERALDQRHALPVVVDLELQALDPVVCLGQ